MSESLKNARHGLLRLHKTLLDWERGRYERTHGRKSNAELLNAFLQDPQFAWLRPMSQLIVRIDEMLEEEEPPSRAEIDTMLEQIKALTSIDQAGDEYAGRYRDALQEASDAVLAHRELVALLQARR
jgi:hypothetical protein